MINYVHPRRTSSYKINLNHPNRPPQTIRPVGSSRSVSLQRGQSIRIA